MKCYNCNATEATPLLMCPSKAQCGGDYKPQNEKWQRQEPCAAYLDKVFSAHQAEGSAIFYPFNTAEDPDNFTRVLDLTPCSDTCCCRNNTLAADAVFEIQRTFVQLDCFSVNETAAPRAPSEVITPEMVTVNGLQVNGITVSNGLYTADLSNIIGQLTNPTCYAQGLPSRAFLLLQNVSDLELRLRLGFEGVVRSAGVIYRFRLYIANNETIPLSDAATTSFNIAAVNIPCVENGMVPQLRFRFSGDAELINPVLSVTENEETGETVVNVAGTLGITPEVCAEVVRSTLLMINAAEKASDTACGLDGFNLYAGRSCCGNENNGNAGVMNTVTRCNCQGNNMIR